MMTHITNLATEGLSAFKWHMKAQTICTDTITASWQANMATSVSTGQSQAADTKITMVSFSSLFGKYATDQDYSRNSA